MIKNNKPREDSRVRMYKAWKRAYDARHDAEQIAKRGKPDGYIFGHPVWLPAAAKGGK